MKLPHHCDDNLFVITKDVGARVSGLRSVGLKTPGPDDPLFKEFHFGLVEKIGEALPSVRVVAYDMVELADEIWSQAIRLKTEISNTIIVSTCAELAATRRGHIIEMNRLVDINGDIVGFGPRPGTNLLSKQIAGIRELGRGKSVVIAEDGAFSGNTIDFLTKQFAKSRVEIAAVIVGICCSKAFENISKTFMGKLIVIEETEKAFEWMPDHDFLPFIPNCGRVFGHMFRDEGMPLYTHEGISFSFPYILPFGNPTKWASIPQEHAFSLSYFCLRQALEIYDHLDKLNNRRLTIRDLSGVAPRVSIPMSCGNGRIPTIDMPISSFLREVCHEF